MATWDTVLQTVVEEFSDLGSAREVTQLVLRLLLAALLGGLLGLQREHQGKAAGIRTHMLVAASSALIVVVSLVPTASAACCRACWRASASSAPAPS